MADSATGTQEDLQVRTDVKDVRMALARAVAGRDVPDEAISKAAESLAASRHKIRAIDVCIYGICLDYIFEGDRWQEALGDLIRPRDGIVHNIEVFPWGIPWPEIFRVRVQQQVDALSPHLSPGLDADLM